MNRSLWPWAIFALLCFSTALIVGLRSPSERRPGEVWAQVEVSDLQKLTLKTPQKSVELLPLGIATAWVKVSSPNQAPEEFLTGPRTRDIFFALSPIWASRTLGKMTKKRREDYGLDERASVLQIQTREGQAQSFLIGRRGFQSSDYFVLDQAKDRGFLWNRETVDLLMDPARLALKNLAFFNPEGLNRLMVFTGSEPKPSRVIIKSSKLWSEEGRSIAFDDPVLVWLQKISKLDIKGYRSSPSESNRILLRLALETESSWDLRLVYDESSKSHFLDLGSGKPQILLDSEAIAPLLAEWNEKKFDQKVPN